MSVAVARIHNARTGTELLREVIRPFTAWDASANCVTTLEPGDVLSTCRIHRHSGHSGSEAYGVEFHTLGRRYTCPLYLFQARTQVVGFVPVGEIPAREEIAV